MNTTIEMIEAMSHVVAMKQALKALEKCSAQLARLGYSANHADQIIPALRTAIAEAESRATEQMEKQRSANEHLEPVAVVSGYYGGQCVVLPTNPARLFNSGTAFYTTPPAAQRPVATPHKWVGLTDEEILELLCIHSDDPEDWHYEMQEVRAIEAKLRAVNGFSCEATEKNGGQA